MQLLSRCFLTAPSQWRRLALCKTHFPFCSMIFFQKATLSCCPSCRLIRLSIRINAFFFQFFFTFLPLSLLSFRFMFSIYIFALLSLAISKFIASSVYLFALCTLPFCPKFLLTRTANDLQRKLDLLANPYPHFSNLLIIFSTCSLHPFHISAHF